MKNGCSTTAKLSKDLGFGGFAGFLIFLS